LLNLHFQLNPQPLLLMLKGALHIHSNLSDGAYSPEEILGMYHAQDFDFVALTDHEYLVRNKDLSSVPDRIGDMIVFGGVELEPPELMYNHVLHIPGSKEELRVLCHPDAYHLTIEEVLEKLNQAPWPVDAVEVTYNGFYTPMYDTSRIPLPKVVTDDAHESWAVGRAWVEVDSPPDRDEIIRAIKAGNFSNAFR